MAICVCTDERYPLVGNIEHMNELLTGIIDSSEIVSHSKRFKTVN